VSTSGWKSSARAAGKIVGRYAETDRILDTLSRACRAMGLIVDADSSGLSASRYLNVAQADEHGDVEYLLKVRVSDHEDRHRTSQQHSRNDISVLCGDSVAQAIADIAERCGRVVPAEYTVEAFAARSRAASAAADTRGATRRDDEARMLSAVLERVGSVRNLGLAAAGRIVDELHGALPRAQRQRLASQAVAVVRERREVEAAGCDPVKLAELSLRYESARARLVGLVADVNAWRALRPAGYPRTMWEEFYSAS
jgi:hypothetical protein